MSTLLKTVTVLDRWGPPSSSVFAAEEGRTSKLLLDPDVWEDMGRPDQITVTVEPGDKLNEAGE